MSEQGGTKQHELPLPAAQTPLGAPGLVGCGGLSGVARRTTSTVVPSTSRAHVHPLLRVRDCLVLHGDGLTRSSQATLTTGAARTLIDVNCRQHHRGQLQHVCGPRAGWLRGALLVCPPRLGLAAGRAHSSTSADDFRMGLYGPSMCTIGPGLRLVTYSLLQCRTRVCILLISHMVARRVDL